MDFREPPKSTSEELKSKSGWYTKVYLYVFIIVCGRLEVSKYKQLLNMFQFFNTICKELTLYNCTRFKRIHNQQLISCDNFQCEDSRMQIYGKFFIPPYDSSEIPFFSVEKWMCSEIVHRFLDFYFVYLFMRSFLNVASNPPSMRGGSSGWHWR